MVHVRTDRSENAARVTSPTPTAFDRKPWSPLAGTLFDHDKAALSTEQADVVAQGKIGISFYKMYPVRVQYPSLPSPAPPPSPPAHPYPKPLMGPK